MLGNLFLALGGWHNIALLHYRVAAVSVVVTASAVVYNISAATAAVTALCRGDRTLPRGTTATTTILV